MADMNVETISVVPVKISSGKVKEQAEKSDLDNIWTHGHSEKTDVQKEPCEELINNPSDIVVEDQGIASNSYDGIVIVRYILDLLGLGPVKGPSEAPAESEKAEGESKSAEAESEKAEGESKSAEAESEKAEGVAQAHGIAEGESKSAEAQSEKAEGVAQAHGIAEGESKSAEAESSEKSCKANEKKIPCAAMESNPGALNGLLKL